MQRQSNGIVRNMSYAILSNGVVMLSSALISLLVPAFCSVSLYGYLQLYLFYTSYLGLFNLGWLEGIYLRIGGISYDNMEASVYKVQYRMFRCYIVLASVVCCLLSILLVKDEMRLIMFLGVSICLIPYALTNYWNNLLLATGRMKEYAKNCFWGRLVFLLTVIGMIVLQIYDLRGIIFADILGKSVAFWIARDACKNLYDRSISSRKWRTMLSEIWTNISCGINLMIANLSGMFILGSIRMGIEYTWSIEVYSQMSLTLSVSNLLMGFISAVSQVMYTTARRMAGEKLAEVYQILRKSIVLLLLGFLMAYYPMKEILVMLLPKYEYGLKYMAILLPMCIIECKWSFLTLTYLKVIREEKNILKVNLFSVLLSGGLTVIFALILKNLFLTVCLVIFVLFVRGMLGERILSRKLECNIKQDIIKEAVLIILFILISWNIDHWLCMVLYVVVYLIYLMTEKKYIAMLYAKAKDYFLKKKQGV